MERLSWRPSVAKNYAYTTSYYSKDINYKCEKCGHAFREVASVPFRCPDCNTELPTLSTLIGETNQDVRVKYYASGG